MTYIFLVFSGCINISIFQAGCDVLPESTGFKGPLFADWSYPLRTSWKFGSVYYFLGTLHKKKEEKYEGVDVVDRYKGPQHMHYMHAQFNSSGL